MKEMNINHNKPYRWLLSMMFIMVVFVLGSCTKEPSTDGELPGEAIYINLSSTDSTQTRNPYFRDEMRITRAIILFYGTVPGVNKDYLVKRIDVRGEGIVYDQMIVIPASEIDTKQKYEIMVIANGYVERPWDTIDELYNARTGIAPIIPPQYGNGLLMSNANGLLSHNFSKNPYAQIRLSFRMVKLNVNVTMSKTFTDNYPDAKFGTGADGISAPNLSVLNLPTSTYLMENDNELSYKERTDCPNLEMTATPTEWTVTAYVAENKVRGTDDKAKAEATYFILQLPYQLNAGGEVVTDNYYKFYINDYAYNNPDPHMTRGGRLYNVSVTVNGFGGALPDINGAQVKTTVLPWEGETSQTDPVGEYLKVPSAIEIEYGEDFKLNIQASHAVTVTKTNQKITMTQVDKVITLRSDDMDTKVKTPNYDKITVKMGSLTKEIKVSYRPHPGYLMAKYNLTGNANGIIFAGPIHSDYGASFKYGCILPLRGYPTVASTDAYGAEDVLWSPAGMVKPTTWASMPTQNLAFVVHTFESIKKGEGDPCRLLGITNITAGNYDNGLWRLPTIKELEKLVNPSDAVRYWRVYIEPSPQPIPMEARIRYRYSDTFDLWLPFAGGRDVDGSLQFVHNWGMWQANSIGIKTSGYYDGISSECSISPLPNGRQPFVINGGSPLTKGHSVRCIQQ